MRLATPRLVLRRWVEADEPSVAEMSADARVMEHLMPLTPEDALGGWIDRQLERLRQHGMCFWAVERIVDGSSIGAVGLLPVSYDAHFTPAVEIGWRLARAHWGQGYASEAATAAIVFGFARLGLDEIVANTVAANVKSRRVMAKLGMTHDCRDDFDHPQVPGGHALRRQVLYRLPRNRWPSPATCSTV